MTHAVVFTADLGLDHLTQTGSTSYSLTIYVSMGLKHGYFTVKLAYLRN